MIKDKKQKDQFEIKLNDILNNEYDFKKIDNAVEYISSIFGDDETLDALNDENIMYTDTALDQCKSDMVNCITDCYNYKTIEAYNKKIHSLEIRYNTFSHYDELSLNDSCEVVKNDIFNAVYNLYEYNFNFEW